MRDRLKKAKYDVLYYRANKKRINKRSAAYYQRNKEKASKDGLDYYYQNRREILKRRAKYYQKNRLRLLKESAEYQKKNRTSVLKNRREHRKQNPKQYYQYGRRYSQRNRGKINARTRNRVRRDPDFKLRVNLRHRLRQAIRGFTKSARTLELLGCTIPELRTHLQSKFQLGMTWGNYGPVWHVDHKKPCAAFDLTDPAQQRACFHWTNLQPMFASDNLRKGAKVSLGE